MMSEPTGREEVDDALKLEEELDEEDRRIARREERFKAQVEKIIQRLKDREAKVEFPRERLTEIREWVEEKNPVWHAEEYFAKQIRGMVIFKRLVALSTISTVNPLNTLVIGDPATGKSEIGLSLIHISEPTRPY